MNRSFPGFYKEMPGGYKIDRGYFSLFTRYAGISITSVPILTALIVVCALSAAAADTTVRRATVSLNDVELQKKMEGLHQHISRNFIHPELNIIYDCMASPQEKDRWGFLPTVEEVRANQPDACGWKTGMENCALSGGIYLAGMVYRYEVTGRPEHAADARRIYEGLRLLATVPKSKGFIARGLLPDGKTYYINSSVDQYTLYVFGIWTYYHSSIATDREKTEIRSIMHEVCNRIERDGFTINTDQGTPALVCEIGVIRSDRSSRLLEIYLVGYDIIGNEHWLDIYREKTAENNYARVTSVTDPAQVSSPYGTAQMAVFALLQNQASLIPLLELESSILLKAAYLEAIRTTAKVVSDRLVLFREYDPKMHNDNYRLGGWRRGESSRPGSLTTEFRVLRMPGEALIVMLMSHGASLVTPYAGLLDAGVAKELTDLSRELLSTYNYAKTRMSDGIYSEIAYWLAVKQGLFKYTAP